VRQIEVNGTIHPDEVRFAKSTRFKPALIRRDGGAIQSKMQQPVGRHVSTSVNGLHKA
jgi:hypothetical protein